MINYLQDTEFFMNDLSQTIIKYLLIILVIYIAFKFIVPLLLELIGMVLMFILKVVLWGVIILSLFLLGNFIYQSHKNNG